MKSVVTVVMSLTMFLVVSGGGVVSAGVGSKVISEATEYVVKTFTREAAEEGVEKIAKQVTKIAEKYGDEGLDAVRKVGPRGIKVIQEAGENGLDAVKLINRYGDDAVWVISKPKGMAVFVKYGDDGARALIKHKGIAEEVIEAHGKPAVGALNAVGTQQARQIAMLQKDGVIKAGEQGDELLDVVGRYGDKAMAFIWRNKGALAVTAGIGTFLANPEAYIDGGKELIVEGVSRPATEMGKEVARHTNWTVLGIAGIGVLGALAAWRTWLRKPATTEA
jgi:hypothetical protein